MNTQKLKFFLIIFPLMGIFATLFALGRADALTPSLPYVRIDMPTGATQNHLLCFHALTTYVECLENVVTRDNNLNDSGCQNLILNNPAFSGLGFSYFTGGNQRPDAPIQCTVSTNTADGGLASTSNVYINNYIICLRSSIGNASNAGGTGTNRPALDRCMENSNGNLVPFRDTSPDPGDDEDDDFRIPLQSAGVCDVLLNISRSAHENCMRCVLRNGGTAANPGGWWTAIGCIPTDFVGIVTVLMEFLIGVAGLFFLFQILYSSFILIASRGDVSKVTAAKERITSAVIAILFIIFSVFILRLVGVDIFNLPGFFQETQEVIAS